MKVSVHWMGELLGKKIEQSPEELSRILLDAGFETASSATYAPCTGVVAAEVLAVEKHPNADKLRLAQVTDGTETTTVVCGAPNLEQGQKVLWAKIGATLPDGTKIKETPIRNVKSPGMLCSARELGVGEDHSGLWILDKSVKPGTLAEELVRVDDTILEVEITPNRPDCLSQIGIARELAAAFSWPIPKLADRNTDYDTMSMVRVEIEDPQGCPLYLARKIENFTIAPSSPQMQARLVRCGIRPINNAVDVTNYVLLEAGQPLHVFDADKIEGNITVRRAKDGEQILALDGKTYKLDPTMLVIADEKKPIAIAGVMGGESTAVTAATRNIILESAIFDRRTVRETRKKLNLASESSYRFERGVSRWSCYRGSARAEALLLESPGSRVTAFSDSSAGQNFSAATIQVRLSHAERLLGEKVSITDLQDTFQRIGVPIVSADKEKIIVQRPDWRVDLTLEVDFIEELARLKGFGKLPSAGRSVRLQENDGGEAYRFRRDAGRALRVLGFQEACNYGLIQRGQANLFSTQDSQIELENPLSEDQCVLRPSLLPELLKNLQQNLAYQKKDARFYEIGTVFGKKGMAHHENTHSAGAACGEVSPSTWAVQNPATVDFYWIKGAVEQSMKSAGVEDWSLEPLSEAATKPSEGTLIQYPCVSALLHPFLSFALNKDGVQVGYFGQIHPKTAKDLDLPESTVAFEMDLALLRQSSKSAHKTKPVLRTPAIRRDCSIWVGNDVLWADLEREIHASGGVLLESCRLFDLYLDKQHPDRKSLSFTLSFRHAEKTLDDDTANQSRDKIVDHLRKTLKAELRGA